MEYSMLSAATFNLIIEYAYKLIALLILWASLRLLEKYNGRPWSNTIQKIEGDPVALAIYQSAVWIGCALVLAS